ncbi:amidohydrolase [Mycobacterium sp. djl-10]|nr:amidohydrolase [Mycobacterium sp. djl-10]
MTTTFVGRVFTADPKRPWAQSVTIDDGKVTALDSPRGKIIEAPGLICPAFHDAHIHLLEGALFDLWVNLHDVPAGQYRAVVAAAAKDLPPSAWLRGGGWSMAAFPSGNPRAETLDAVTGGRPAYLTARDGHSAWVNSAALRLAGINAGTPDPPGGRIERDDSGEAIGALHETAMGLVRDRLPEITAAEWGASLELGQRYLHSLGIAAWQDARLSEPMLRAYVEAEAENRLRARVAGAMHWDPTDGVEQIARLVAARELAGNKLVQASMVKIFVDGVVENRTAALLQPYHCSHSHGDPLFTQEALNAAVHTCVQNSLSVHVHAIGDAATTAALDAFENAPSSALRHQICHVQVVSPADVRRFARLGVIANVQALWACRDEQNVELCEPALGTERFEAQYPFGDLHRAGTTLAFGSDWRVSTPDPLAQMEVAMTRQPPGDTATPALGPTQRLDLKTCMLGFTRHAAYAAGMDQHTGSLTIGRDADIVLLDRDPFSVAAHEVSSVCVDATYVRGERVFERG